MAALALISFVAPRPKCGWFCQNDPPFTRPGCSSPDGFIVAYSDAVPTAPKNPTCVRGRIQTKRFWLSQTRSGATTKAHPLGRRLRAERDRIPRNETWDPLIHEVINSEKTLETIMPNAPLAPAMAFYRKIHKTIVKDTSTNPIHPIILDIVARRDSNLSSPPRTIIGLRI